MGCVGSFLTLFMNMLAYVGAILVQKAVPSNWSQNYLLNSKILFVKTNFSSLIGKLGQKLFFIKLPLNGEV